MSNTPIELKGSSFTLSVVHLHEAEPKVIHQALEDKIAQAPAFLKHAPVVLNVSALEDPVNWSAMHKAVSATGLRVIGVSGCKDAQLKAEIEKMGLPILTEGKEKAPRPAPAPQAPAQNTTPVTKDLIVTSHVSAGAELIADGNIHVYGMMRGRALAGASGDRETQIFCTNLMAELVSIAGEYWLSDQIPAEFYGKAARLQLVENALTVQPLN
ncbi:septum site-determining protein MinC [Escherichia coli]|nr:septum site-determining protein MinC [Escherichia coli]